MVHKDNDVPSAAMSLTSMMSISTSGLNAAATRLEASASNIANAQSSGPLPDASGSSTAYQPLRVTQSDVKGGGVSARLTRVSDPYITTSDPTSPDANEDGLVAMPNVDMAGEMVNILTARMSYEASAKTMKVANDMMKTTLDAFS